MAGEHHGESDRSKPLTLPLFLVTSLTWGWALGHCLCCLAAELRADTGEITIEASSHVGITNGLTCNLCEFLDEKELFLGFQGPILWKFYSPHLIGILAQSIIIAVF